MKRTEKKEFGDSGTVSGYYEVRRNDVVLVIDCVDWNLIFDKRVFDSVSDAEKFVNETYNLTLKF